MKLPESKPRLVLLATVAIFLAAISVCRLTELALGLPEQDQVEQIRALWREGGWKFALTVVWILAATPVIEETLFRFPTRFIRHPAFAVVISMVFSFCHYINFAAIASGRGFALLPLSNAFLALFLVGLAWCWLYRRTGCLWCTMLSHSLFNATNLVLALVF